MHVFHHLWVTIIGALILVRSLFSLVEPSIRGIRLIIWVVIFGLGVTVIFLSVI